MPYPVYKDIDTPSFNGMSSLLTLGQSIFSNAGTAAENALGKFNEIRKDQVLKPLYLATITEKDPLKRMELAKQYESEISNNASIHADDIASYGTWATPRFKDAFDYQTENQNRDYLNLQKSLLQSGNLNEFQSILAGADPTQLGATNSAALDKQSQYLLNTLRAPEAEKVREYFRSQFAKGNYNPALINTKFYSPSQIEDERDIYKARASQALNNSFKTSADIYASQVGETSDSLYYDSGTFDTIKAMTEESKGRPLTKDEEAYLLGQYKVDDTLRSVPSIEITNPDVVKLETARKQAKEKQELANNALLARKAHTDNLYKEAGKRIFSNNPNYFTEEQLREAKDDPSRSSEYLEMMAHNEALITSGGLAMDQFKASSILGAEQAKDPNEQHVYKTNIEPVFNYIKSSIPEKLANSISHDPYAAQAIAALGIKFGAADAKKIVSKIIEENPDMVNSEQFRIRLVDNVDNIFQSIDTLPSNIKNNLASHYTDIAVTSDKSTKNLKEEAKEAGTAYLNAQKELEAYPEGNRTQSLKPTSYEGAKAYVDQTVQAALKASDEATTWDAVSKVYTGSALDPDKLIKLISGTGKGSDDPNQIRAEIQELRKLYSDVPLEDMMGIIALSTKEAGLIDKVFFDKSNTVDKKTFQQYVDSQGGIQKLLQTLSAAKLQAEASKANADAKIQKAQRVKNIWAQINATDSPVERAYLIRSLYRNTPKKSK